MKRRQFLGLGMGALALGGCGVFSEPSRLKVWWVAGRLPKGLTRTFAQKTPLEIKEFASAPALWESWQKVTALEKPHLVSLGDGWLDRARRADLLQPLAIADAELTLAAPWGDLGRRQGLTYGWPWRWGTWVIAYRRDRLSPSAVPSPTPWADLNRLTAPRSLVLPDSPPLALAIALRQGGHTYGDHVPSLPRDLQNLKARVLTWDSRNPLKILLHGDVQAAVVSSAEAAAAQRNYPQQLAIAQPTPPLLWAEVWMQVQPHPAIAEWLRFCQSPTVQAHLRSRPGTQSTATPPPAASDWLRPLLPDTARHYQAAWENS
ncbi:MAG: extracellular solute-binding protein [Pseudanabaenaceae cyanobacterium]